MSKIITENQLDSWVRGNARDAQGVTVELVKRLVAASCPAPRDRRFPGGDSIEQPGPDGVLDTDRPFKPFVPEGKSVWEIGAGVGAGRKATSDYRERTSTTPRDERLESAFIFVTPLSARTDWPSTWKEKSQLSWMKRWRDRKEWRDVRVIDGARLVDWLQYFPGVELWLAEKMGFPAGELRTPEQCWREVRDIGAPPPLIPEVFLANRDAAKEKLRGVFAGEIPQLKLDTYFPDQVATFVAAYLASSTDDAIADEVARCLFVSGPDGLNSLVALRDRHVLVVTFGLDGTDREATMLLERARKAGHAVIYGGAPGGIPHPNRAPVPNPSSHQVEEALRKAGYSEQRAHNLGIRTNGDLGCLLRCISNLSLVPEWAQGTTAAELAIAELLGSWDETSDGDRAVAEELSKKAYGEWIGAIRDVLSRPGTPLRHRNGIWKLASRYEGWFSLGPRIFDEHLDRLKKVAIGVLQERDPKFELAPEERFAASIHGRVLTRSGVLRVGFAETLALLGSHPKALTTCSSGRAEATAALAVREILTNADWVLWASLDALLPLLAEAAPAEFLDAVERSLKESPCPFDELFGQERNALMGGNSVTGLLWALEDLAWDAEYLTRAVVLLGELAARDPGGNWANRPANSLSTILLPWFPQTCAPPEKRQAAVATLLKECPEIAWKLLLTLLPSSYGTSTGSYKPQWRETIPDDWCGGVTDQGYREDVTAYVALATSAATGDVLKLSDLIDRLDDLPPQAREQVLAHLRSEAVSSMSEGARLPIWNKLNDLVSKHRRNADANWAIGTEELGEIAAIAERLAPTAAFYRHQRLFSERNFDLYDEAGNYNDNFDKLEGRRREAVRDLFAHGGIKEVLSFVQTVESPWRVGFASASLAPDDPEREILPALLESGDKPLLQFAGGFVQGRFTGRGWNWVDAIDTSLWSPSERAQLLAYLPFTTDAWARSARLLGEDEGPYWRRANANPYAAKESIKFAIDRLLQYGRPREAIKCLEWLRHQKLPIDTPQAVRALRALLGPAEDTAAMDTHAIVEVIKALQDDPGTSPTKIMGIEWAFLPLLNEHNRASPVLLERRLADEPAFFCEVIQIVFRSMKGKERPVEGTTEQQKSIATNAYHLLDRWSTLPGSRRDGTFDGDAFTAWLDAVKAACNDSGHLEIAMSRFGHTLVHSPPDADGLWIHHSVATALNARDASEMRHGFRMQLYNSRGFHWVNPTGEEERKLARDYRAKADDAEARGYHRLAGTLRELAVTYDREAERVVSENADDE